jgi:FlaA1/EpsC-like NDP-sugar epimerase
VNKLLDYRKPLILLSQATFITLTYVCSFLLRFDLRLGADEKYLVAYTLPLVLATKLLIFYGFGLLRGWWRYVGMSDALDITKASVVSFSCLYVAIKIVIDVSGYPRSVLIIDMALTVLIVGGTRFLVRAYTEGLQQSVEERSVLVVGAGRAGSTIVREMKRNPQLGMRPIGFLDDDASKHGIRIHGVRVLGSTDRISEIIRQNTIQSVLIAIPSARGSQIERIVNKCQQCRVDFKILPPISRHINGNSARIAALRDLRLEDLLGREPVQIDLATIRNQLEGRVLLITGAGGSIGSELSRQVANFQPRSIILLERSENCLFRLEMELSANLPHQHFIPLIADIQDVASLRDIFALHRPEIVFHAAAYKHVPMMEHNCFQAVTNNVFGTYNVALLARQFACKSFVMISSDKAVNPTNVMGVTKRIAELIMLGLAHQNTRYVAVRFGNVLGSNGSVVPIFQQQIRDGGPITVTHPEARRYFMTIPEAVQLVLQASVMGDSSEIFFLDMGKAVRVVDLARNLIRLSGLEPDRDIEIVYTGLRPGEKLFEELTLDGEGLKHTSHPKIRVLNGTAVKFDLVRLWLDELASLVAAKNVHGLVQMFRQIVPEYKPSEEILASAQIDRHDMGQSFRRARQQLWYSALDAA